MKHVYYLFIGIVLVILQVGSVNAEWQSGYYGSPSFELRDDPGLIDFRQKIRQLENKISKFEKEITEVKRDLKNQRGEKQTILNKISSTQTKIEQAKNKKKQLSQEKINIKNKLPEINSKITNTQSQIDTVKTEIPQIKSNIDNKKNQLADKKSKKENLKGKLDTFLTECRSVGNEGCESKPKAQNLKNKISELQNEINNLKTKISEIQSKLEKKKSNLSMLQNKKSELVTKKQELKNRLPEINNKIANIETKNRERRQNLQNLKSKRQNIQGQIDQTKSKLVNLETKYQDKVNRLAGVKNNRNQYRRNLIARINEVNRAGFNEGSSDGSADGNRLALDLGSDNGNDDGRNDGYDDGTRDGRRRDYNRGYGKGEIDGEARANLEGLQDGVRDGTIQGNKDVAKKEGIEAGNIRALNSDASNVGEKQGIAAGMDRAIQTGNREGTPIGEREGIETFENVDLPNAEIRGDFAGVFSRNVPDYTGPTNRSYNTSESYRFRRDVIKRAYIDGYDFGYKTSSRSSFYQNIDTYYNNAYQASYESSYSNAYNLNYEDSRQRGYADGEIAAFNRYYPGIYNEHFDSARAVANSNPNRESSEYKTTYKNVEKATFLNKYEEIRLAQYEKLETKTFSDNIENQTEIYRKARFDQIVAIYSTNPVLKFNSTSILDGGINGVAQFDGIYQPGEDVLHSITITNYGLIEDKNVVIKLQDGAAYKLAAIPGKSIVTVKGAGKSVILRSASVNSNYKMSTGISSKLIAEAKIQGRHFQSREQGILIGSDEKSKIIKYPLQLNDLKEASTLLMDEENSLGITITNISSRKYVGAINIELTINSNSNILMKNFESISEVGKSIRVKDALIKVTDESDVYVPIVMSGKIFKNGVLLGFLNESYSTIAKATYISKEGIPVIVANFEKNREDILEMVSMFGSIKNISVLDLSLSQRNAEYISNGFNKKTIIIPGEKEKSIVEIIDNFMKKSTDSGILLFGDSFTKDDLTELSSMKDGFSEKFLLKGLSEEILIANSNPFRNKSIKDDIFIMKGEKNKIKEYVEVSELLRQTNPEMIQMIDTISKQDYLDATDFVVRKIQLLNIKNLLEILNINIAYDKSKKGWLFGRDKKWLKKIEEDQSLLLNALKSELTKFEPIDKTSLFQIGLSATFTVNNAFYLYQPIKREILFRISWSIDKVKRSINKLISKKFKDFDRELYQTSKKLAEVFTPFVPGVEEEEEEDY